MLEAILLGKGAVASRCAVFGVIESFQAFNVEDIDVEEANSKLVGFGIAEGLFFDEHAAGNAALPVHLHFQESLLALWAGVDVIVLAPRVVCAGVRIVADWNVQAVEVIGYEDF